MTSFLNGRLALVTGSTSGEYLQVLPFAIFTHFSTGIGLGIAKSLAKAGADVVIHGFGDINTIQSICGGKTSLFGRLCAYDQLTVQCLCFYR